jgi:hypothetical protein
VGLLGALSSLEEVVPGSISELDVGPRLGEERRPHVFRGDEITGFGEIELGKLAGDGLEDVGVACFAGDES